MSYSISFLDVLNSCEKMHIDVDKKNTTVEKIKMNYKKMLQYVDFNQSKDYLIGVVHNLEFYRCNFASFYVNNCKIELNEEQKKNSL